VTVSRAERCVGGDDDLVSAVERSCRLGTWRLRMRYERPAVERRVKVEDPVITVAAIGSPS
jgi:hypothetical protein